MGRGLTVGSLFAGIGGFDLGLERAGMKVAWQCEIDPYCKAVLKKHWPNVPCYDDVTKLKGDTVERVDILCGGFPCQDISVAGRQAGIAGSRSGLWSEFNRLIGELRPSYAIIENVSALKSKGLNVVLADLAASGYDAEWQCLPASAFGAPHQRDRIWIVAYPERNKLRVEQGRWIRTGGKDPTFTSINGEAQHLADTTSERLERRPLSKSARPSHSKFARRRRVASKSVCNANSLGRYRRSRARQKQAGSRQPKNTNWWSVEPDVGRVADGVPNRVHRTKALGNALVPQIAQYIGERIINAQANT